MAQSEGAVYKNTGIVGATVFEGIPHPYYPFFTYTSRSIEVQ